MSAAGDVERLIVVLEAKINDFEKGMKRAENQGTATFQKLVDGSYKATTSVEKQMQATAAAMGRSMEQIFGSAKTWASRAAMNAEFKGFIQAKAAVDQLRASYDPAFAASERFRQGVAQLDEALAKGAIETAEHAAMVARLKAEYAAAVPSVDAQTGVLGRLGNMSSATKAKVQGVGFQVQDMAVQMAAGTSATTAMAQQLPQLLGGFGLVGVAVGTLASVGLPLLGAMFGKTKGGADSLSGSITALENSVAALNEAATRYTADGLEAMRKKYGEIDLAVVGLMNRQAQFAKDRAEVDADAAVTALAEAYGVMSINLNAVGNAAKPTAMALLNLQNSLGLTLDQAKALVRAMQDADAATTFEGKAEALGRVADIMQESTARASDLTKGVLDAESAMRELANAAPRSTWLGAAMAQVEELTAKLWAAVYAKGALGDKTGTVLGSQGFGGRPEGLADQNGGAIGAAKNRIAANASAGAGRGGGGGGGSGRVEALLQDLQTERETVEAWNAESLATLATATDAQLAAVGGRHAALERLEAEHQERLRGIRDTASGGALANAETFFGAMATVSAAGGAKLARAAQASAAIEAGINVLRAQAQVLADPKLGFWAKLPAMAAIGAAGLKVVSALGGGGRAVAASSAASSSGASAGSATPSAPAVPDITINFKGVEPGKILSTDMVRDMADVLTKEFGRRGMNVGFAL
ncbi:hypothetical protein [Stagnihabitans tardus]|uniref:Bacteriophage tail tape measure N-terminal domain-containing protein n=1 Tax=Stagnihabitans tardus TaxID=2699202 RepID=A0AAE4Y8J6_9RHOB|nr:hypothetical protein [Stagnihabitans tardus]NBZ87913.1 hypothetical protein [Stagnihabitans tardus]